MNQQSNNSCSKNLVQCPKVEDNAEDVEHTGSITWNYCKVDGAQSERGGASPARNITCTFCDTSLTGCSSSRAFAHVLGKAVLAQKKANVGACVPLRKKDDNRHAEFMIGQKALNKEMMAKDRSVARKQGNLFWIQQYLQEKEQ